ncbi:MAG: transposase [bacterium]
MSRSIIFAPDEFYHCYDRGTEKRKIFLNKIDYERFLALLFVCNSTERIHLSDYKGRSFDELFVIDRKGSLVDIGVYCLMPNHFHLLLHEKVDNGISLFMQKLSTAYTMYFNKKYERTGSLFESRFKAEHADDDKYLKYLFSYIHLNPVKLIQKDWKEKGIKNKKEAVTFLQNYKYSSYVDYLNFNRPQSVILNKSAFPEYFNTKDKFEEEIFDWLQLSRLNLDSDN